MAEVEDSQYTCNSLSVREGNPFGREAVNPLPGISEVIAKVLRPVHEDDRLRD